MEPEQSLKTCTVDQRQTVIANMDMLQNLITAEDSAQFIESLFEKRMISLSQLKAHQEISLTMYKIKNMIRFLVGPQHHQIYESFREWLGKTNQKELLSYFPSSSFDIPVGATNKSPTGDGHESRSTLEDGEEDSESLLTGKLVPFDRPRPSVMFRNSQMLVSYPVNQGSPGTALIVVNEKFPSGNSGFSRRTGANLDMHHLNSLFSWLGYRVNLLQNAGIADLIYEITKIRLDSSHYKDSSFVLTISSIGHNNSVFMADGKKIKLSEIYDLIDGNSFPSMSSKPKFVYVDLALPGVKSTESLEKGIPFTLTSTPGTLISAAQQRVNVVQADSVSDTELPATQVNAPAQIISNKRIACKSDFVIVMSSFPGFNSFHNSAIGSLTTFVLCDTIYKYCDQEPLTALLRRTRRRILNPDLANSCKQTLTTFETLTKQFYMVASADGTAV